MDRAQTPDPRSKGKAPPFKEHRQAPPGLESEMDNRPDYGEHSYRGSGKLAGKTALITGGDSGIGRAVAIAFAREGANIAISYLPEEAEDAAKTKDVALRDRNGSADRQVLLLPGDISREEHCKKLIETTVQECGGIDILVNNAATQTTYEDISEIPLSNFEHTFRVNVFAMFNLCKAAIPHMKPGSTIINVASIQAYDPSANLLAYASTKGAIVTFSKALAQQSAEKGIRVNVVAPGPIWTPLISSTMPEEKVKNFGKNTPLKRPGQPAELAPTFVLLASDDSSYITGEVIGITGGHVLP